MTGKRPMECGSFGPDSSGLRKCDLSRTQAPAFKAAALAAALQNGLLHGQAFMHNPDLAAPKPLSIEAGHTMWVMISSQGEVDPRKRDG